MHQNIHKNHSKTDAILIQETLKKLAPSMPHKIIDTLNPYPLEISRDFYRRIADVWTVLDKSLRAFLREWTLDPDAMLPVDERAKQLCLRSIDSNVTLGSYRYHFCLAAAPSSDFCSPDFLPGANEADWHICEINARFVFNGFLMSHFGHMAQAQMPWETPVSTLQNFMLEAFFGRFVADKPVYVLSGREKGNDILTLRDFSAYSSLRFVFLNLFVDIVPEEAAQFILELHQDEVLQLSEPLLEQLIRGTCLNPLHTIFLIHDKRLLAVLADDWVLKHITVEDHELLKAHIAPTRLLGCDKTPPTDLVSSRASWILKPAGEGKGVNITFGKNATAEQWSTLLSEHWDADPHNWVLQKYVPLSERDIFQDGIWKKLKIIGTFFAIDAEFFGVSCWRASQEELIAVSRGGSWLLGSVASKSSPYRALGVSSILQVDQMSQVNDVISKLPDILGRDGCAVLQLAFTDEESRFMRQIGNSLGVPDKHSTHDGDVWDIKIKPNSAVRSHTAGEFEWHTDSSFEQVPPKYLIVQVVHEDCLGGGLFQIAKVSDILARLSPKDRESLKRAEFSVKRPAEFQKDGLTDLKCSLVFQDGQSIRYRKDIVRTHSVEAQQALESFASVVETMAPLVELELRVGMILIVDNHKYLHARTGVQDKNRHLRRMRINACA